MRQLVVFEEYLHKIIDEFEDRITLDDIAIYENKKLEAVLSLQKHMASVGILPDLTYDFLAVESDSENIVLNRTENYTCVEDLCIALKKDIVTFIELGGR